MSPFRCARERELKELLHQGHWPKACSDDLRSHVAGCRSCSDLVLVSTAFQAARKQTAEAARLEPAGALWWRAHLRRRNAAIEAVVRPIFGAQIFAMAITVAMLVGFLIWQGGNVSAWIQDLPGALHLDALIPTSLPSFSGELWVVVSVFATVALLGGLVAYFASEKQ